MRILIVAGNISARMGGEAVIPLHYIRELTALGCDVHALTHERVRAELEAHPLWNPERFHFVADSGAERAIHAVGKRAPASLRETLFMSGIGLVTQQRLAARARSLAASIGADVIHQPTPVSPAFPSFLSNMPAPVVIGPMNGGMDYPPAFRAVYSRGSQSVVAAARVFAGAGNALVTGKREAAVLLVSNARTRDALPAGLDRSRVIELVENGVDLSLWDRPARPKHQTPEFIFVGRLIWLKGTDLLLEAMERVPGALLRIIGDGPERANLERKAANCSAADRIRFDGFLPQTEIAERLAAATALVLPSMRECGGAVILEAFACRTAAIATDWGGPKDYVTPDNGFLVAPSGREAFIEDFSAAMRALTADPARAVAMGESGRARVEAQFTWFAKARQMLTIYENAKRG